MLREPLVQFLLLGAAILAVHAALGGPLRAGPAPVVVDDALVEWLAASHARQFGTAPTEAETDAAVQRHVRDVVVLAEARRRGLDVGDTVVDRRLIQKMEFLLEGAPEPTDAALEDFLAAHAERYAVPARGDVTHRFFSQRRTDAEEDARQGEGGDPFPLGATFTGPIARIERDLGLPGALGGLAVGVWHGPLRSPYGWHLVRIDGRTDARTRPLPEVRAEVLRDWGTEARARAREVAIDALVAEADVRIAPR